MHTTDYQARMTIFRNKCRQHNLKITPQRTAICKELIKAHDHPSTLTIFKKVRKIFPGISFDTVNRTLLTFSEIGLISVVEGYGRPRRFDSDAKLHHHFRCVKCDAIVDSHSKSFDRIKVPREVQKRFTVLNKRIVLEGICEMCSKKQ